MYRFDFFRFSGLSRLQDEISKFRRDDSGAMYLLVLIWVMLMIPVAGMAIDFTRAETMRVRVQNTLDRAVLAAADIDQTLDPKDVVMDYFLKAGLARFISRDDITVTPESGDVLRTGREVQASARGYIGTSMLSWFNIEQLGAPGAAGAREAKSNIEVMLVLDVSGSMGSNNRLPNLKVAARDFVDTVLMSNTAEGDISIGIVPYNGQVNARRILPYYTVLGDHTNGSCVNFTPTQFTETSLSPATSVLPRANVFDPWYSSQSINTTYCPIKAVQEILPITNNATRLKNHITAFIAEGNTSLDIGMKWGTAMLDPSFRAVNALLAVAGEVPPNLADRPFDYTLKNTAKFIILMSDGENTDEYIINEPYRSGLSPVYVNSSGQITIYHESRSGSNKFYRFNANTWNNSPYSGSIQLKWADVWARYTIRWVADKLYQTPLGWSNTQRNNFIAAVRGATQPATKNTRTSEICRAAKLRGITVFTIGFEAPSGGTTVLRDCATSPGHFFDVQGIEISTAFQVIARKISELRLIN